jgi:hypothetical protein
LWPRASVGECPPPYSPGRILRPRPACPNDDDEQSDMPRAIARQPVISRIGNWLQFKRTRCFFVTGIQH